MRIVNDNISKKDNLKSGKKCIDEKDVSDEESDA